MSSTKKDIGISIVTKERLSKRTSKKEQKQDRKLQKRLNPEGCENNTREKQIWYDSKKAWLKARRATDQVKKAEKKCTFYRYDENGRKIGLVFDEQD